MATPGGGRVANGLFSSAALISGTLSSCTGGLWVETEARMSVLLMILPSAAMKFFLTKMAIQRL